MPPQPFVPGAEAVQGRAAPGRQGVHLARARARAAPLLWGVCSPAEAAPSEEAWARLGQTLLHGDPLADAAVSWMEAVGAPRAWGMFEQGVRAGSASLGADSPLRRLLAVAERPPPWVDRAAMARAAQVTARAGAAGSYALRDLGLMAGYRASAINQTLIRTGALEGSAARRLSRTTAWWLACTEPGGLERGSPGYVATLRVRLIHALVRRQVGSDPDWDAAYLGTPVNQLDMQATYLAFSVLFLMGQRWLGVPVGAAEAADVMALWRTIGWLMGVDEALLVDSERDGRVALYHNLLSQPLADPSSQQLGRALSTEPLQRRYASLPGLRRRWNHQLHLSVVRLFVGAEGMRELGLPGGVLPWYPIVTAPPRHITHQVARHVPGGEAWLARTGRAAQRGIYASMEPGGEHAPPGRAPSG
jgi:hypothetical protein